jgi:hypothetical protein
MLVLVLSEAVILTWVYLSWQRLDDLRIIVLAEGRILNWVYLSWQRLGFSPGYTCPGRDWDSHLGIFVLAEAGNLTWVYLSRQRLRFYLSILFW